MIVVEKLSLTFLREYLIQCRRLVRRHHSGPEWT